MDLLLSEEEELLQSSLRELLQKEVPISLVEEMETSRAIPASLWASLRQAGWLGLGVAESAGGNGGGIVDWVLALEEMGKVACPAPVAEHGAVAIALSRAGAGDWLRPVVAGETVATIASVGDGEPAAVSGGTVTGTKKLVPFAESAGVIVALGREGDAKVAAAVERTAAGVSLSPVTTLSGTPSAKVAFAGAQALQVLPGAELKRLYLLGQDAYALGLIGHILELTVEYAKDRVQFGRPIGAFQAVQHHCADLAFLYHGLQGLVYQAAWLAANGREAEIELEMCHAYARQAAAQATVHGHQVHGAMGFTAEYPLQYFSRRAKAFSTAHGRKDEHYENVARLMPAAAAAKFAAV